MSLKKTITKILSKGSLEVQRCFFNSEADESSMNDDYLEEESREVFLELYNQGIAFKNEDSYGGEGEGEQYWSVYSFSNKEGEKVYVKFDGWYQSYHGSEFNEWFFVEPKQKTITVFE